MKFNLLAFKVVALAVALLLHSHTTIIGHGGYPSPFEKNVLSILQALNDNMLQMKNNPSVSQSEVITLFILISSQNDVR